ncbi:MAG TPA: OmpH family outer membrane protein [Negativicutes bacterium]|jgi:outer membrane protein
MKTRKTMLLLITVFMITVLLSGCGTTQNVGVLDVNKVMTDSPKVKEFQDQLNVKGKELGDQLEKDKASLKPEDFQKRQEDAYGQFMKLKQDMEGQIDAAIKQTLDQVAKDKKMGIVLYKNGVAQGGTDITDEVIQKMQ